jgi:hypothetical protein
MFFFLYIVFLHFHILIFLHPHIFLYLYIFYLDIFSFILLFFTHRQTFCTHAGHPFLRGHVISHERISIGQEEAYCNFSVEESFWEKELGKMPFYFRFWRSNLIRGKSEVLCRVVALPREVWEVLVQSQVRLNRIWGLGVK